MAGIYKVNIHVIQSKGQGQAKYCHQIQMLHEYCAIHVLGVIWDREFDGDGNFLVWLEERSMSDQTRSN